MGMILRVLFILGAVWVVESALGGDLEHRDKVALFQKVSQSVVKVHVEDAGTRGTGFILRLPSGTLGVVTNAHVCTKSTGMVVVGYGPRLIPGKIVKLALQNDLCLIRLFTKLPSLDLANSVPLNGWAYAVGFPMSYGLTMTEGMLYENLTPDQTAMININREDCQKSGGVWVDKSLDPLSSLYGVTSECTIAVASQRTGIKAYPGNSGSPVVGPDGRVLGVVSSIDTRSFDSFIITLEALRKFVE